MRFGSRFQSMVWVFMLILLIHLKPSLTFAQGGRASVTGIVTDPSGAVVPDANVIATNTATRVTIATKTNEAGAYSIPLLVIGTYDVTAKRSGFKTATQTAITLTADQELSLNLILAVGETSEVVEVKGNAAMIEGQTAALASVVSQRAVVELPLNGRNPANLVLLTPGTIDILSAPGTPGRQSYTTFPTEQGASTNGGRQGSTLYLLDGTLNMDPYEGLAAPFPNPEATQEFRVISNNFEAQYGFAAGGVVSIVTGSGTNQWHGNAFEFLRNGDFNASNTFTHRRDELRRNQFGGSIGGAVLKDRLFVFGNTQMTQEFLRVGGSQTWVLTQDMLSGDFSKVGVAVKDPTTGQPAPGGKIPVSLFSPAALKMAQNLPTSSDPTGYIVVPGAGRTTWYKEFTTRADYYISANHRVFGRTYWNNFDQPILPASFVNSDRSWLALWQSHMGSYTWTITPTILNNLTGSFSRNSSNSNSGLRGKDGKDICYSQYIAVADPTTRPCSIEDFNVAGGISVGQNWNSISHWTVSVNDSLSITKGRHLIVAGVDLNRQSFHLADNWLGLPRVQFSSAATGFGYGDFLVGRVNFFQQGAGDDEVIKGTQLGVYVQDQIKVKPNLTVSVGGRWEPFFAPVTSGGHLPAWVPGEQSHVYPNAPVGEVFPGDPGIPEAGFPSRRWIFDPRLGVAWQPMARTSIRAAFGMFSAPLQYTYWGHAGENAPFSPNYTLQATDPTISASYSHSLFNIPFDNPWANFAPTGGKSPFPPFQDPSHSPPAGTTFIRPVGLGGPFDQHFTLPTELAWNFSIQHNFKSDWLVSGAYVASETYHLADIVERNPGIYAAGGLRTLYPNFASVQVQESAATSSFESLQLSVEKRFSHGLQFQSNYTFSKTLDSATSGSIQFAGSVLDPFNLKNNKSWSGLYVPHTFKTNFVYQTPSLNGVNAFLRNVAGAWQLSGIWTWRTGQPFGIAGGCCDRNLTHINTRADYVPGQKVSWGGDRLNYFNTAAFQRSAPGSIGNTPRLFMFSPSIPAFDVGIAKNWTYRERYKLQFRWEAFNAFNHVVYGIPTTDIENSRYGQIFGLNNSPRLMQIALKLNF